MTFSARAVFFLLLGLVTTSMSIPTFQSRSDSHTQYAVADFSGNEVRNLADQFSN